MPKLRRTSALLIASVALAACGGGGGGGSSPAPTPAPTPTPTPISITADNAQDAVLVGTSFIEGTLQVTGLATEILQSVEADPTAPSTACSNGGTIDFTFSDNDQDGAPSPGDTIRASFSNCRTVELNAVASGDLLLTLDTPTQQSGPEDRYYRGRIDASSLVITADIGGTVTIGGEIAFTLDDELFTETTRASGDLDFEVTFMGQTVTESVSNFSVERTLLFDEARYSVTASGQITSELLDGTLTYDPTTLSGFLNTFPDAGRIRVLGAGSSAEALAGVDADTRVAVIQYDTGSGGVTEQMRRPGWTEFVEGFVWWYRDESPDAYVFRDVRPDDFFVISRSPDTRATVGVNPVLIIQFSRPVAAASLPTNFFVRQNSTNPSLEVDLPIAADLRGARLVSRPLQQLLHDAEFSYPSPSLVLEDNAGNVEVVGTRQFFTGDTLSSVPLPSDPFGVSGTSVTLDGTKSEAVDSAIATYQWQQTAGTPGQIGNTAQPTTTFTVPAVADAEQLEFELTVSNTEGEFNTAGFPFTAFASEAAIRVLNLYGEPGGPVRGGRPALVTSANSTLFDARVDVPNVVEVVILTTVELGSLWNLKFGGPDDTLVQVGVYENASSNPGPGQPRLDISGTGCSATGRFEVLEIVYGVGDEVLSAAIDFEVECSFSTGRTLGSVRVASDAPIPEPPTP